MHLNLSKNYIGGASSFHAAAVKVVMSKSLGCDRPVRAEVAGKLPDVLKASTLMQNLDVSRNYFRGAAAPTATHVLLSDKVHYISIQGLPAGC